MPGAAGQGSSELSAKTNYFANRTNNSKWITCATTDHWQLAKLVYRWSIGAINLSEHLRGETKTKCLQGSYPLI